MKKKKVHFELLTRRLDFYFFTFEVLTRSWKIKSYISSYELHGCTFIFSLSSCEREVDKWKNSLIISVSKWHGMSHSTTFLYLAWVAVSAYVISIWVCWILMAYASSTAYLLTRLPHEGDNYNGREIELFHMKWFNCG